MDYRFYFLDSDARISGASCGFAAADDAEALQKAQAVYRASIFPHHGFEIWEGRRCIRPRNASPIAAFAGASDRAASHGR